MDKNSPLDSLQLESLKIELPQDKDEQPEIISAIKEPFTKKSKLEIWKIFVVAVLAVGLVAGAAVFWFTRNPDRAPQITNLEEENATPAPAQAWETYTNTKYSYSIDYPSD